MGNASERQSLSLDGIWEFRHGDGAWLQASVPLPWQAQFPELAQSAGEATYRRTFTLPADWRGKAVAIHFGAVSYFARVVLNGVLLGEHEGAYLPFAFEIDPALLRADNELVVTAILPSADRAAFPDYPFDEVPHGKLSWYGRVGGIWQSVRLEARDSRRLESVVITAGMDRLLAAELAFTPAASGLAGRAEVLDGTGAVLASAAFTAADAVKLSLPVPDARLWGIGQPNLYGLAVTLGEGIDHHEERFGFRSVSTEGGRILLNGEPFYMRAALDQDYYSRSIYTTPSLEFLEDQAHKAIALGLNTLRCHIKVPDPRYYEVADRFGLLVWTEVPNVATFTAASAQRLLDTLEGILRRDRNHPSIIAWTIINEDWGTRLVENAEHREWLGRSFDWLKAEDPTRLVVDNSPCFPNFHVKTDINDFHYYRSVPERRQEWDDLTAQFAAGADWTFSPLGDAQRRGDEPLIVSEFGVWGLPDPALLRDSEGKEPDWFESGSGWGDGAALPHGVEARFAALDLARVFGSFESFVTAAQWYQFMNLRYEIEQIRLHETISGYVITELTDVHWEANGLMDMERNPRVFHDQFSSINADLVIVPRPARYAGEAGAPLSIAVTLAAGGHALPEGAVLRWSGAGAGEVACGAVAPMGTLALGDVVVRLPVGSGNSMARVDFTLEAGGKVLAHNSCDIAVFGARRPADLSIGAHDEELADFARGLGYRVTSPETADLVLCRTLDEGRIGAIKAGANYLLIADGEQPTPANLRTDMPEGEAPHRDIVADGRKFAPALDHYEPNMRLVARDGTIWRGDWIAGFSWLRREGAFADIPGGPLFDLAYSNLVPRYLVTGARPWEFGTAVTQIHAGTVVGWVHKPAAIVSEKQLGRGRLVVSTFRLMTEAPGADPLASALFDALVRTAGGTAA